MKTILFTALLVLSAPAFSAFNEVECEVQTAASLITLEIEQSFPTNSSVKSASMTVTDVNGVQKYFDYTVMARGSHGFNRLTYFGGGLTLDIDLWPDNRPQWGRTYRSTLVSSDIGSGQIQNVSCSFPNAN